MSQTAASSTAADTIREVYAAFGRGDVAAILDKVSEDVSWESWGDSFAQRAGVPWLAARSGRDGVAEFFGVVGAFAISEFSVLDVMAGERQVAAEIVVEVALPEGGRYRDEELHLWTFDDRGRICRMRHYADTAKQIAAAGGEDTTA